ncbi:PREDICTED: uncharacterized protein LOC108361063 [Rhagoletis zephyria]|uniref:uncharacterized protein LOC108361063 n=1 Tax=Rhagoletis zephyria TaxID=28612 RepID=UPI00081163DB|nr:PREDICTED: uncharacterized protein LOC108361063 [Rhagoletis zephyria]
MLALLTYRTQWLTRVGKTKLIATANTCSTDSDNAVSPIENAALPGAATMNTNVTSNHVESASDDRYLSYAAAAAFAAASVPLNTDNIISNNIKGAHAKAKPRNIIIGCNPTAELAVASPMKWLHLSSFKSSVTAEHIINYVSNHSSIPSASISCYVLVKKDVCTDSLKRVNFKLGISSMYYSKLLNSNM